MPYITQTAREIVNESGKTETAGELNYALTVLVLDYLQRKGLSYQNINDVLGALEGAKAEFYRRVVVPYEDDKRRNNGDVDGYVTVRQKPGL